VVRINREKFKVLDGVFDEKTLDVLTKFKQKKYFDKLLNPIKTGKEADAYLCSLGDELRVLKIYRVTSANFKKISTYINRDFRFRTIKGNLRKVIYAWVSKEFRNINLCYKAGVNVPYPYKFYENVLLMEYIDGPMLKDVDLDNPQEFFDLLLEQMLLMFRSAKLIHGDLSEYNILVKDNIPYIIDLGQAMLIKREEDFENLKDLFERDLSNIINYFNKRYNLDLDYSNIYGLFFGDRGLETRDRK
jgi:RIO kinase 1